VEAAAQAWPLNLRGVVRRQLLAIEPQQAIQALDSAWLEHLDAIIRSTKRSSSCCARLANRRFRTKWS
jgi:hypothetical protein